MQNEKNTITINKNVTENFLPNEVIEMIGKQLSFQDLVNFLVVNKYSFDAYFLPWKQTAKIEDIINTVIRCCNGWQPDVTLHLINRIRVKCPTILDALERTFNLKARMIYILIEQNPQKIRALFNNDTKVQKLLNSKDNSNLILSIQSSIYGAFTASTNQNEIQKAKLCLLASLKNGKPHFSNLNGANLSNTDLSNTDLSRSNLIRANLSNANLFNTDLHNACFSNADFRFANLNGTNIIKADMTGANLYKAIINNPRRKIAGKTLIALGVTLSILGLTLLLLLTISAGSALLFAFALATIIGGFLTFGLGINFIVSKTKYTTECVAPRIQQSTNSAATSKFSLPISLQKKLSFFFKYPLKTKTEGEETQPLLDETTTTNTHQR